jgi:hypothetical protein
VRLAATYVVPLRWTGPGPIDDLAAHLATVSEWVDEVIVVDDSPSELHASHAGRLPAAVRHLTPAAAMPSPNGKVDGILTGVAAARNERIVIADDDVRWERGPLERAVGLLDEAELIRPQNHFRPLVWHARWDTARSLLNRVVTGDRKFPLGDFPGTFALRRDFLLGIGGYDGSALFENLELMRKTIARGGRVLTVLDLYVPRHPPTFAHFRSQRVRQAYDDWSMPLRMTVFLALLPMLAGLLLRRRKRAAAAVIAAPAAIAEVGRRRAGGVRHFPVSASLLAPLWTLERGVCIWIAFWRGLRGTGVHYSRGRITRAASSPARLRAERTNPAPSPALAPALSLEADRLVGAVAKGPRP